jgi:hypothetical protein
MGCRSSKLHGRAQLGRAHLGPLPQGEAHQGGPNKLVSERRTAHALAVALLGAALAKLETTRAQTVAPNEQRRGPKMRNRDHGVWGVLLPASGAFLFMVLGT